MRLDGKFGIVMGAGQIPGETIGNGRATSILLAREGATLLLADRVLAAAEETAAMIRAEGGSAECIEADWTDADQCAAVAERARQAFGRIDLLHNNVGTGRGDAPPNRLRGPDLDRLLNINLIGCLQSCQAVIPSMKEQGGGSIVNISSIAAVASTPLTGYKLAKAAMNALGQSLALANAAHGIRVNTIMPGLMDTPNAIEAYADAGRPRDEVRAGRDASVPLRRKMGTAWDVAYAALFLHSDEANFITGVTLPVDGGQSARGRLRRLRPSPRAL